MDPTGDEEEQQMEDQQ
jgi:hypothetical protein